MKTILLADDHPITLAGIKAHVVSLNYNVIATCKNGSEAYDGILKLQPDLVILDLNMPEMNGLEVLEKVRNEGLDVKIILYTMYHEKSFLTRAKSLGVNGYLLKDFAIEELSICLKKVQTNEFWFSPKLNESLIINKHDSITEKILSLTTSERKILALIGQDFSSKTIAEMLFVTEKTIEKHRTNIISKLGLPQERNILQRFALQNQITE